MKRSGAFVRVLRAINNYLVFFLVVAFAVTCCTLLFVTVMSEAGNIPLTDDNIRLAAKLTMLGEGSVGEWRRMRLCGIILTLINLSVSSAVLMMLFFDRGAKYDGLFIYVVAAYTFYAVTLSVINIVKYRKYKSPVLSSVKVLSLATALVSMLMLTAAMLSSFGGETPEETKKGLIAGAGALISALILTLSSYMIIRSTKEIEKSSKEKSDE